MKTPHLTDHRPVPQPAEVQTTDYSLYTDIVGAVRDELFRHHVPPRSKRGRQLEEQVLPRCLDAALRIDDKTITPTPTKHNKVVPSKLRQAINTICQKSVRHERRVGLVFVPEPRLENNVALVRRESLDAEDGETETGHPDYRKAHADEDRLIEKIDRERAVLRAIGTEGQEFILEYMSGNIPKTAANRQRLCRLRKKLKDLKLFFE